VIRGHLYVDNDNSRSRTTGDDGIGSSTVLAEIIRPDGSGGVQHATSSEQRTGAWEFRGLADGTYRILWEPPIPPELYDETIPPAQEIQISTIETIRVVTTTVEIRGANRVTDIDFGVPRQGPIAAPRALPSTGGGGSSGHAGLVALASVLVAGPALVIAAELQRRRRRRQAQ
jgi:hypothetical protein